MCSWSLFLKLKSCSHCLQMTLKQAFSCLICFRNRLNEKNWAEHSTHEWYWDEKCETDVVNDWFSVFDASSNEIVENAHARFRPKSCMMMKLDWFLNHANAKFRRHLSNKSSTFDSQYRSWCCICWRCFRKSITLLYRSNSKISHMSVESNIPISTEIDVDFEISMTFWWAFCSINSIFASHLIWHSVNLTSRCVCFWIFCSVSWTFFCLNSSIAKIFAFAYIWDCNLVNSIWSLISSTNEQSELWYDL